MLYLVEGQLAPGDRQQIDFSVVLNRIFLEVYREPWQFWNDVVKVYEFYEKLVENQPESDQMKLSSRMRELTVFVFQNWVVDMEKELE